VGLSSTRRRHHSSPLLTGPFLRVQAREKDVELEVILDTEEEAGGDGAGAGPPAPGLGLGSAGSSGRALLRRMSASAGAGGFPPRGISAHGSRLATPSPGVHLRTPTPAVAAVASGVAGGAHLSRIPSASGTNPVPLQHHGKAPSGGLNNLKNLARASSRTAASSFVFVEIIIKRIE